MLTIEGRSVVKGGRVTYVPFHAKGDKKHADCLHGFITSSNDSFVFVNYDEQDNIPQATSVKNLVWWTS